MPRKLPPDAFDFYLGLGLSRSYQAVADRFEVTKKAVTKHAVKETWQRRIEEIERKAREATTQKNVESLEAINQRHLKSVRFIQAKAIEALKSMPIESAMDAVRALESGIRQERLIIGEPSDRSALTVEEVIRREYQSWMTVEVKTRGREPEEESDGDENGLQQGGLLPGPEIRPAPRPG